MVMSKLFLHKKVVPGTRSFKAFHSCTAQHGFLAGIIFAKINSAMVGFSNPIAQAFAWGARRYYDLWDALIGRGIRKKFLHHSKYKNQWI